METHMGTHFKGAEKRDFYAKHMSKQYSCECGKIFRSKGFYDRHIKTCNHYRRFLHQLPASQIQPESGIGIIDQVDRPQSSKITEIEPDQS